MKLRNSIIVAMVAVFSVTALHAQNVDTTKVVARTVDRTVRLPGEIAPYERVAIYARVASFVDSVLVDRGSVVKRGQLLVKLIAPELAAQVAESESKAQAVMLQLAEAEAKLVAARTTARMMKAASETQGAVSESEVILSEQALQAAQAVRTAVENSAQAAKSAVEAVKQLASYLDVKAPFDGIVTERLVHPGALVGPATAGVSAPLLQLEQNYRLRLVVAVPESYVAGIVKGATVSFMVPAYPDENFQGIIARSSQALDTRTRSMVVELDTFNSNAKLASGMYADVIWPVRRPGASLLVPTTAVITTSERTFVIRARNGTAEWVNVRRGSPSGDMVEVFGDLRAGDDIVKRGNDEIREGTSLSQRAAPSPGNRSSTYQ